MKQEPVYCQGNDNGCNNPNYQCTTMGTLQQCCPTYLFICSRNGGIPTEVYNTAGGLPTEYFDVGIPDGSGSTSPRFYYDSREGRCIQFSVSRLSSAIHNGITVPGTGWQLQQLPQSGPLREILLQK